MFHAVQRPPLSAVQSDDEGLLSLIEDQCAQPRPLLDLNFALRVCSSNNKHHACVQLYKSLKMYDEALDAALKVGALLLFCCFAVAVAAARQCISRDCCHHTLQVDMDTAEEVANTPDIDDALKKSLWMKLLRHAIQKNPDVSTCAAISTGCASRMVCSQPLCARSALDLMKRCDVLKIDDILSLFPDFTVIESFKVWHVQCFAQSGTVFPGHNRVRFHFFPRRPRSANPLRRAAGSYRTFART